MAKPKEGRSRVVIENVEPQISCGRFPVKRIAGDVVSVEADVFGDGHDLVRARLLWKPEASATWQSIEMRSLRSPAAIATPSLVKWIILEPGAAT